MEEGRSDRMIIRRNSDGTKGPKLKKIHTQIIKLQKKQLGQKDKIAFCLPIGISIIGQIIEKIQLVTKQNQEDTLGCHYRLTLKAQVASMANTDNTNKNTRTSGTPVTRPSTAKTTGPQESILRDKLAFVHFRISTLETTLEDIQVHQNLLQSENPDHQASILVVYCSRILL
ncbi:hypothetical protein Tco_0312433 [Tanacetum coccineum]